MDAIRAVGLTKKYKDIVAVNDLDLNIKKGELFSLLGLNGAGKTTIVKMLCCLTKPTSGDAFLNGCSLSEQSAEVKKIIGVSPQKTAVAPNLNVRENLELMCGIHGFSKQKSRTKTEELADKFSLQEVLNRKAGKLSGGWQRKLSIAMAMAGEPEIMCLDEPTLGLDVIARSELWNVILAMKGNITVILTTHYMDEAERLSDRVGIMRSGRLLTVGTPEELKARESVEKFEDAFISIVRRNNL